MSIYLNSLLRGALALALVASPALAGAASVNERLQRLERVVESGALAEMVNQMEQMRRELQLVRGDLEVVQRELDDLKQQQREVYQDSDRRLRQLETAQTQEPATPPAPSEDEITPLPVPTPQSTEEAATQLGDSEWEAYQRAFRTLRSGRYGEAVAAFTSFLEQYPDGRYTDNALYWLGESHYAVRDFDSALPYFVRIVDTLPTSGKRADATLKIGFIHHEQGRIERAIAVLEQLQRDFEGTTAATLAERRVQRIRAVQ
jgi:tol-pal system protein YbgF